MTDPTAPRTVEPHGQYPGATQINVDGRCFQVAGIGSEAVAMLEAHAECVLTGLAIPQYPSRRTWSDGEIVESGEDAAGSAAPVPSRVSGGRGRPSSEGRSQ